jgi:hypothetical protein
MSDKFTVAYIHGDEVSAEFMSSMTSMLLRDAQGAKKIRNVVPMRSTVNICNARNNVVRHFLNSGDDWLLMIDSDMVFRPTLIDDLFRGFTNVEEMPIIGALTFSATRNGMVVPHIYYWAPEKSKETLSTVKVYSKNKIIKVGAIGAGCFAVHKDALGMIFASHKDDYHPWFKEVMYKGTLLGEDVTFCKRARDINIPIHVNTGVKVGHSKPMIISEPMYDRQLKLDSLL